MSDLALEVDNVVKEYGEKRAVDGLTFTARRGELLALLGPNGAGKTTTIEMCEGFTTPTSGSIRVLGIDPVTQPQKVRDRIGIMLQGGGSYASLKVREILQLAARYNTNPHDPDWLIELLGLEGVAKTTYRRLSGGQQQRLSLALAMIGRPELIFLDEPTAGMDAQSRLAVWDIIQAMKRDGTTVLLTTHLMDEAETLADDVAIIDHGKLVAQGSPAELTSHEEYPVVAVRTDRKLDVHLLNDELRALDITAEAVSPQRYRILGAGSPAVIEALARSAAQQNVLIRDLSMSHRDLEDVFLDITGRELRS
ncbi:spermidine/putrescine ABC transporter ATP-binding protein [Corynebacterium sp. HMSC067D03]|uniref:ABC transporter ATP-binding protein n=1 Tax=unclassified Corynebacterium TaxID=2624378 RepID=UPI0008A196FF|nr:MULTISPECIES: ABC transporter ATP-binding protein [unclassified Corynebacterium]OFL16312.1 spermidine/putrescine ABC transporter ATP-binding protein [Corynebacterium sp. HMSC067D03]OFO36586.1 spermidine/putrescine ABC transporter ATP-binding protein [Corynebacterium sp. HMSC075D04]OHO32012.1 spermidine/putrescine ABC transporter ATP-binding protein [Corynebacterium sp. HMSC034B08]OHO34197.1 spermidine/putrescine ABC transporter ATP-binding protein [Corynebacterium sp. HMSC034E11]OHQ51168.1 